MEYSGLSVKYANTRNGQVREFYVNELDECVAATCCNCRSLKPTKDFYKTKNKKYGLDSRCIACSKVRRIFRKYVPIDFSLKIKKYAKLNKIRNYKISFGKQKNGYKRVVLLKNNLPIALSCCTCLDILPVHSYEHDSRSRFFELSSECYRCSTERNSARYKK